MSEIKKQEIFKREKLTWAPPYAAQPAGRPSPPLQPSVVFLPSPRSSCVLARARPRGHLLLADEPLAAWTTPAGRPDPADRFAHSPPSTLPPLLPLSRLDRTEPPSPTSSLAATATPSLPLHTPELRPDPMKLHHDACDAGCPVATPSPPSSSPRPAIAAVRFAAPKTSPSSPRPPLHPL